MCLCLPEAFGLLSVLLAAVLMTHFQNRSYFSFLWLNGADPALCGAERYLTASGGALD